MEEHYTSPSLNTKHANRLHQEPYTSSKKIKKLKKLKTLRPTRLCGHHFPTWETPLTKE